MNLMGGEKQLKFIRAQFQNRCKNIVSTSILGKGFEEWGPMEMGHWEGLSLGNVHERGAPSKELAAVELFERRRAA